jgi:hypothetical protein
VIEEAGSVKTAEDLKAVAFKYPYPMHARYPGPLIRFLLYEIEDTKNCGFLINGKWTMPSAKIESTDVL